MNRKRFMFTLNFMCVPALFLLLSCQTSTTLFSVVGVAGDILDMPGLSQVGYSAAKASSSIDSASETITPQAEYYIGRAVAATIYNSYLPYEEEELALYANKICLSMAATSDVPELYAGYRVGILDSRQINAFATSGGHIMITRGLLQCAQSEDALAAVIAHEMAHIQLGHSIKAIKTNRITNAVFDTVNATVTALSVEDLEKGVETLDDSVNDIVSTMVDKGYSKSQEYDADEKALQIMEAAGYDPTAMVSMLEVLQEKQGRSAGGFASTHPSAKSRIQKVSKILSGREAKEIPLERTERFALYEGLF